jgi:hypothetical protein
VQAGSYLRQTDSCITQLKAQGPSRTCNESKEEREEVSFPRISAGNVTICALHKALKLIAPGKLTSDERSVVRRVAGTSDKCATVPRRARI